MDSIFAPRFKRHSWRLALLLFLGSGCCNATIVLVTLTRDEIYVAADGRVTVISESGEQTPASGCKIRQFGRVVVAHSGTVSDARANFNIWDIFGSIKADSIAEFANRAAEMLPDKFQAIVNDTGRSDKTKPKLIPEDFAILGFENGKPAYVRILLFNQDGMVKAIQKDDGKEFQADLKLNPALVAGPNPVGEYDAIPFKDLMNAPCISRHVEQATRCLLKAYIEADPKHINEPIAIMRITAHGASWVEKGMCEGKK